MTWLTARWTTRANPSVGWARSRSSSGSGLISASRNVSSLSWTRLTEPPQCLTTSAVFSSPSSASSRCSRPENSWPASGGVVERSPDGGFQLRAQHEVTTFVSITPLGSSATKRHLVLARELDDLVRLGLGDVVGENAGDADPLGVDVQHDLPRGRRVVLEVLHQHVDDELLGRVVVVVQQAPRKGVGARPWASQECPAPPWAWTGSRDPQSCRGAWAFVSNVARS